MSLSQNDFEEKVKLIYKNEFSKEINELIDYYFNKIEKESEFYENKKFIIISKPSNWLPTDETFVWIKTIDILTGGLLETIILATLEMKGHSKPNFWLNFPNDDFSNVKITSGFSFPFSEELIQNYDFRKYIVQPFEINQ